MVRVNSYQKRTSLEGENYYVLELQSDQLEFVISKRTGRPYATVMRSWMPTTFSEEVCQMMIGKSMPGTIKKVECEPYTFYIEDIGEEITRAFRYEYVPVEDSPEDAVFNSEVNKEFA